MASDILNRLLTAKAEGGTNYGHYSQVGYAYNSAGNITSFEGAAFTYIDYRTEHMC